MLNQFDSENMFNAIWMFPDNLKDAYQLGENISLKNSYIGVENIVIAGMGGSAIGGDVLSILENKNFKIPIITCRDYSLPSWINDKTLVICSSYSGNTEETLSSMEDAISKNAMICGITTGGELASRLSKIQKDVILIPSGLQPRAALAYSFIPMAKLLEKAGIIKLNMEDWLENTISALSHARELYSLENKDNPIYELAQQIYKKIPIIYADISTLGIAAMRLKGQICENGKMLAYHNELPEMNHNEIVGWENNIDFFKRLFVIWLNDIDDNQRVKYRKEITQDILNNIGIDQYVIEVMGNSFEERFLHSIHYGDWLSFWCAIFHKTDPSPVDKITVLKNKLKKK